MINDYSEGGLKMIDISSFHKSLKATFIEIPIQVLLFLSVTLNSTSFPGSLCLNDNGNLGNEVD